MIGEPFNIENLYLREALTLFISNDGCRRDFIHNKYIESKNPNSIRSREIPWLITKCEEVLKDYEKTQIEFNKTKDKYDDNSLVIHHWHEVEDKFKNDRANIIGWVKNFGKNNNPEQIFKDVSVYVEEKENNLKQIAIKYKCSSFDLYSLIKNIKEYQRKLQTPPNRMKTGGLNWIQHERNIGHYNYLIDSHIREIYNRQK